MRKILNVLSKMFDPEAGIRVFEQISLFCAIGGLISILFEGNQTSETVTVAITFIVIAWFLRSQFSDMGGKK